MSQEQETTKATRSEVTTAATPETRGNGGTVLRFPRSGPDSHP